MMCLARTLVLVCFLLWGDVTLVGILTFTVCWKHFVGGTSDFYGLCVKADEKSQILVTSRLDSLS